MEESMRLYWETVKEECSNEILIHSNFNPLRQYEEEFVDGPILELGCGQSAYLLEYCKSGREIFALDNDQYQLNELEERILKMNATSNVNYINSTILKDPIPQNEYSLVIMSNILHFFNLTQCRALIDELKPLTKTGSIFFTVCHSQKHPHNNPSDPANNDYFKHYFSEHDLDVLFPIQSFERIFHADVRKILSNFEVEIIHKWLNKIFDLQNIRDTEYRKNEIEKYLGEKKEADLLSLYRKI